MTQSRAGLSPGTTVRLTTDPAVGVVTTSDDWYDGLRLRGVPDSAQVLIEWRRNGQPTRLWERVTDLVIVRADANGGAR